MSELQMLAYYSNSYTSELLELIKSHRPGISRAAKILELQPNSILAVLFMLTGIGPSKSYYDFSWIGYFLHDSLSYTLSFIDFFKRRKVIANSKLFYNNTSRDPCSYCLYDRELLVKEKTGYKPFRSEPDIPRSGIFLETTCQVINEKGQVVDLPQSNDDYNIQCLQIFYGWISDIDSKKLATSYTRQYRAVTGRSIQSIAKLQNELFELQTIRLVRDPVYWQIAVLVGIPKTLPKTRVKLIRLEKTSLKSTNYTSDQWLIQDSNFLQALLATLRIYNLYNHY